MVPSRLTVPSWTLHRERLLPLALGEQAEMEHGYLGSVTHAGVSSRPELPGKRAQTLS